MEKVKVLYEYTSEGENELSLFKDEIISVIVKEESGWAEGVKVDGTRGWFSVAFVTPYVEPTPPPPSEPVKLRTTTTQSNNHHNNHNNKDSKDNHKKARRPISSKIMFNNPSNTGKVRIII